jgi:c-di-GMP-binding flagellar brake protein YcgR
MGEAPIMERRKQQRFPLELSARLETTVEDKEVLSLQTANISCGGAFFRTPDPLPLGTHVELNLIVPLKQLKKLHDTDLAIIRITGTIIRSEEAGMSVKFGKHFKIRPYATPPLPDVFSGDSLTM